MKPSALADEADLEKLEAQFPSAADTVFSDAYEQAVQSGLSIVVAVGAQVFEVFPDGSKRHIKTIEPPT